MTHPISDAMVGMTPEQRAAYKAQQMAAAPAPDTLLAGDRMVAVSDLAYENGLLRFNVTLWIDSGFGFEVIDTSAVNPVYVKNPPILVPDPGGDIERTMTNPATGVVTSVFYREDTDQALMQIAFDVTAHLTGTGGEM